MPDDIASEGQELIQQGLLDLLAAKDAEIARLTAERTAMIINAGNIDCDSCKHNGIGDCEDIDPDCMTCDCDCICKSCRDNSNWEWRGARED